MKPEANEQERVFLEKEADEWFSRNYPHAPVAAPTDHAVLQALGAMELPPRGTLFDVGGGPGDLAAGFRRDHPGWSGRVLEASQRAIAAGRAAFPDLEFIHGSISRPADFVANPADVVVVSAVFHWVDRSVLAQAVANVDRALREGGVLVVRDFDSPTLRANPYHHHPGLFTYKQDYAKIFTALGTYHENSRKCEVVESARDPGDPYDRQWVTVILRKDLFGRYYPGR